MEVRPASPGPVERDAGSPSAGPARSPSPPSSDATTSLSHSPQQGDSAVLEHISAANLERILAAALPDVSPAVVAQADTIVRGALASVVEGNMAQAMILLEKAILLDPRQTETLPSDPQFAPVSAQVDQLVAKLAHGASIDAEVLASRASDVLHASPAHVGQEWIKDATQLHTVALRLLDANTYVNSLRSAHLSQAIIDSAAQFNPALNVFVPAGSEPDRPAFGLGHRSQLDTPESERSHPAPSKFKSLVLAVWRRAPLLLLLLAWFALGLGGFALAALSGASNSAFTMLYEIWAVGFLALVGLGFYARVRNIRFGP